MSHWNFSRLALSQDIQNAKQTIKNLEKALSRELDEDTKDYCQRELANQTKRLQVLRNTNPLNY